MSSVIKFGTSGWRAIVADEFTLANIRLAIAGIAAYVKTQPEPHRVLVGRDPRFLGEISSWGWIVQARACFTKSVCCAEPIRPSPACQITTGWCRHREYTRFRRTVPDSEASMR